MKIDISIINVYVAIILNSVFTGAGVAIGNYLAEKHIINKTKKIILRILRRKKNAKD